MAAERRQAGEWKRIELQLDTAQIVLVIASLLGLCAASFFLGRWLERDRWQDQSGRTAPQSTKIQETDAAAGLTFFDTLGKSASEPGRQAHPSPAPAPAPASPSRAPNPSVASPPAAAPPSSAAGGFAIQVFAGDRTQAEKVASSLSRKGYAARVVAGTGGPRSARVRVTGYKTRAEADRAASRLEKEDNLHPWVVKPE
jgi:cell division protein FtsN